VNSDTVQVVHDAVTKACGVVRIHNAHLAILGMLFSVCVVSARDYYIQNQLPAESAGKRERQGYFLCVFVITTPDSCSRRLIIWAQFLKHGNLVTFRTFSINASYGKLVHLIQRAKELVYWKRRTCQYLLIGAKKTP
jgi:hypothetical protein